MLEQALIFIIKAVTQVRPNPVTELVALTYLQIKLYRQLTVQALAINLIINNRVKLAISVLVDNDL